MARVIKILFLLVLVSGSVVGGYFWLQAREPDDGGLELVPVTRGSITEKAVAVGQIEPRVEFQVKSKLPGIVKRCLIEVGDRVAAGDPLFEIVPDPTPVELVEAERRVESAQSTFNRARANWARISELSRQGIVSSNELDSAREDFEQARIQRESSEDNLKLVREGRIADRGQEMESIIRAPAGGIVLRRTVDPGDPVVPLTSFQAGTELATIADMSDLIFKGTVDEIDVGKLAPGVPARLKIGALPEALVTGTLSRIAPQAREEDGARLFDVEIELDPVQDVVLRAGYSSNADLVIREKNDILLVPERLVLFEGDGEQTFVEIPPELPGGEPRKVEVETGLSDGLNIEIVDGVEEFDEIVQRPPRDILG